MNLRERLLELYDNEAVVNKYLPTLEKNFNAVRTVGKDYINPSTTLRDELAIDVKDPMEYFNKYAFTLMCNVNEDPYHYIYTYDGDEICRVHVTVENDLSYMYFVPTSLFTLSEIDEGLWEEKELLKAFSKISIEEGGVSYLLPDVEDTLGLKESLDSFYTRSLRSSYDPFNDLPCSLKGLKFI